MDRKPNVFVEIKGFDPKARWMGPRQHQQRYGRGLYGSSGSIEFEDDLSIKQHDITASILKKGVHSNTINLSEFSDFDDFIARIEYVYSFKDLKEKGHYFESGNIIPETDFPSARSHIKKMEV